jgi:CrcB protein
MKHVALVAVGGAAGSVLRYLAGLAFRPYSGQAFPLSTFTVNIVGCFFIGLFFAIWQHTEAFAIVRPLLIIGLLGGFTTFSSFSFEALSLFENKEHAKALLYITGSNVLGIAAAYLGYKLAL